MCPLAQADGHDQPGLIDELVPGLAAQRDDVVVGREDPVREPVVAHELPDILDRVQFWGSGRQEQQGYVVGQLELGRDVPACLVEDQDGVGAGIDGPTDLFQVLVHGLGIAVGQDEAGAFAFLGTDGAEDIGPQRALIVWRTGPRAALCPAPGELVLLAYAGLVRPPEFELGAARKLRLDLCQFGGKVFLKTFTSEPFWEKWRGRAESLAKPSPFNSRPTVVSSSEIPNASKIHWARSLRRHRTTPWIAGIGPLSTILATAWRCASLSLQGLPGALPSMRPSGPRALNRTTQSRTI